MESSFAEGDGLEGGCCGGGYPDHHLEVAIPPHARYTTTSITFLLLRSWSCSEKHANARSLETESSTQLILQVALIGEMERLGVISKKEGGWRIHLGLRRVVNLQHLTMINCRVMPANRILHYLIETRSRNTQETHISNVQYHFKQRLHMIARFCRGKNNWSIGNKLETFRDNLAIALGAFDFLIGLRDISLAFSASLSLGQVPLVDNHYNTFCFVLNFAGYVCILSSQSFTCIDQEQHHFRALDGPPPPQHTLFLDTRADPSTPSYSSGVDQDQLFALKLHFGIYSIAGCPWYIADNRALETQDGIEQ